METQTDKTKQEINMKNQKWKQIFDNKSVDKVYLKSSEPNAIV